MVKVVFLETYFRGLVKTLTKYPDLNEEIENRVLWFRKNPKDTRLKDHALKKKMKGKYAFSITNDIRIIYRWVGKNKAQFLNIGKHIDVY